MASESSSVRVDLLNSEYPHFQCCFLGLKCKWSKRVFLIQPSLLLIFLLMRNEIGQQLAILKVTKFIMTPDTYRKFCRFKIKNLKEIRPFHRHGDLPSCGRHSDRWITSPSNKQPNKIHIAKRERGDPPISDRNYAGH